MAFVGAGSGIPPMSGKTHGVLCARSRCANVTRAKKTLRVSMSAVQPTGVQPEDFIFMGVAGLVLVGAFFLQKSLGDVVADEAGLPPAGSAKSRREAQRSSRFLQKKNRSDDE
ncbi:hypothetical protein FVE85_2690 [Porphyridium purpureum]|uniref:Uncharacterized protein n=1 Tax=Porphyridium purpureum TaxID=35688 RepID=A0A5J4YSQ6_PORPP|nr:hypothetical protein FVE85_2690 [Porphyridium purpureum]|eukprot:POR1619..scf227_4